MLREAVSENLSKTAVTLLSTLLLEAVCPDSVSEHLKVTQHIEEILKTSQRRSSEIFAVVDPTDGGRPSLPKSTGAEQGTENVNDGGTKESEEIPSCVQLSGTGVPSCRRTERDSANHMTSLGADHKVTDISKDTSSAPKRAKLCDILVPNLDVAAVPCPMFFYDLHKKKLPGINLPK